MSTTDEARAEARSRAGYRYPGGLSVDGILQRGYEHGFGEGAEWQASRKAEPVKPCPVCGMAPEADTPSSWYQWHDDNCSGEVNEPTGASRKVEAPADVSTHPDAPRIKQSNDIAYTVIEVAQNLNPAQFVTLDFRYAIADALWAAGFRKVEVTDDRKNCGLDADGRVTAKPHDPYPIKVRTKAGNWVTTLPMSALGHHLPHEVQEFAPGTEFCQRPGHYFTALSAALGGGEHAGN